MLRTDRNRGHQVSAKHSSFGQALENLLQGHGLSVSNCSAMTYTLPPLNALRAFEAAARHLSFKLAAHELHVTPAAVGQADNLAGWLTAAMNDPNGTPAMQAHDLVSTGV
jgi:LysR family glycine cleavage system transcriptional activator